MLDSTISLRDTNPEAILEEIDVHPNASAITRGFIERLTEQNPDLPANQAAVIALAFQSGYIAHICRDIEYDMWVNSER
ncbi:MAG: hypothetical protein ACLFPU_05485 [Dehalococcoidia bacterium]